MSLPLAGAGLPRPISRATLVSAINTLTGDTRLLWLPQAADTTTSADAGPIGRTVTHNATLAGRLTAQGSFGGQLAAYASASSQYSDTPDTADLSFGTGAADSSFTVAVLANVTDTAAERCLVAKFTPLGTLREYRFNVATDDTVLLLLYDESAVAQPFRQSNVAIPLGSVALLAATYDVTAGSGATAATGITLYVNGAAVASTATNAAGYVAMENTTSLLEIGARNAHTSGFLDGSLGMVLLAGGAFTAAKHAQLAAYCRQYFGATL